MDKIFTAVFDVLTRGGSNFDPSITDAVLFLGGLVIASLAIGAVPILICRRVNRYSEGLKQNRLKQNQQISSDAATSRFKSRFKNDDSHPPPVNWLIEGPLLFLLLFLSIQEIDDVYGKWFVGIVALVFLIFRPHFFREDKRIAEQLADTVLYCGDCLRICGYKGRAQRDISFAEIRSLKTYTIPYDLVKMTLKEGSVIYFAPAKDWYFNALRDRLARRRGI
jgi:hypothetical protein